MRGCVVWCMFALVGSCGFGLIELVLGCLLLFGVVLGFCWFAVKVV